MKRRGRPTLPKSKKFVVISISLSRSLLRALDAKVEEYHKSGMGSGTSRSSIVAKILDIVLRDQKGAQ